MLCVKVKVVCMGRRGRDLYLLLFLCMAFDYTNLPLHFCPSRGSHEGLGLLHGFTVFLFLLSSHEVSCPNVKGLA